MDNHFEKEFYGYEPQRPMTEKHEIPPSVQPALDIDEFEPQKPLMKGEHYAQQPTVQPTQPYAEEPSELPEQPSEQSYNPIRHTAVFGDNGFTEVSSNISLTAHSSTVSPFLRKPPGNAHIPL